MSSTLLISSSRGSWESVPNHALTAFNANNSATAVGFCLSFSNRNRLMSRDVAKLRSRTQASFDNCSTSFGSSSFCRTVLLLKDNPSRNPGTPPEDNKTTSCLFLERKTSHGEITSETVETNTRQKT